MRQLYVVSHFLVDRLSKINMSYNAALLDDTSSIYKTHKRTVRKKTDTIRMGYLFRSLASCIEMNQCIFRTALLRSD